MINASTKSSETHFQNVKIPWVTFIFLSVVFFVAQHDLFFSLMMEDMSWRVGIADSTLEGSAARRIVFLILGVFGIVCLMRRSRKPLKIYGLFGWLIVSYLLLAFLSLVWADSFALTFRRLVVFAMFCLGAVALAGCFSLRDIILYIFFSAIMFLLIGICAEVALGILRPFEPGYRFAGTQHPNSQGLNCALLLLSSFTAAWYMKRGYKFFVAGALIGLVFLVLTKSRSSFASAIFALFVYWSLVSSTSRKLTIVLVLSLTFCLLMLLVGDTLFLTMRRAILLGRENPSDDTLVGRIPLWNQCLEYVSKRPFLGYGYGGFWTPHHIRKISEFQDWGISEAHSIYLEHLLSVGCIGMIAFISIFILGIRKSVNYLKASRNRGYAFLCSLLLFCLVGGLLESSTANSSYLMFLSMVVLANLGFQKPQKYEEYC